MKILRGILDTNIFIDFDRNHSGAIEWWNSMLDDGWHFWISEITLMEGLKAAACLRGPRKQWLDEFCERVELMRKQKKITRIVPVTKRISNKGTELLLAFCGYATPVQESDRVICDILIAATALEYDVTFFTHDVGHFSRINGLNCKKPGYELNHSL